MRQHRSGNKHMNAQMLLQGLQDCKTQPAYTIKSIEWYFYSDEIYRKLLNFITHTESMKLIRGGQSDLTHFNQWLPTCRLKTLALHHLKPHNIEMVSRALTAVRSTEDTEHEEVRVHTPEHAGLCIHAPAEPVAN